MQVSANLYWATAEASESGVQVTSAFNDQITPISGAEPAFEKMDRLDLGLALFHPLGGRPPDRPKARFHTPTKTVYASAPIDYERWIDEDWARRADAVAEALTAAVGAVAKSRLTAEERATVFEILRVSTERTNASPPRRMAPLASVYLMFNPGDDKPSVSFAGRDRGALPDGARIEEVRPCDLRTYMAKRSPETPPSPSLFKFYTRRDGDLHYREGWIDQDKVVEHFGVCGERGETRSHPAGDGTAAQALLKTLNREAAATGFKPIPMSRHKGLIVEKSIGGFGSPDDLDLRHELQAFLDDRLGWLGLGHCDGGSTESGTMEAYCLVVDGAVALEALTRELASSKFSDFRARLSPEGG